MRDERCVMSRRRMLATGAGAALAAPAAWAAQGPGGGAPPPPPAGVQRLDPSFDALVGPDPEIEVIMEGFQTAEGPCWIGGADGYLLVSDVGLNVIRRWSPSDGGSEWLSPSGYGAASIMFREQGSNGLIAARGGLVMCDTGNRGLAFVDLRTKRKTMLARTFEGRRFNGPNDLVLAPDGSIYFTDPYYGLHGQQASPYRELDFAGVYRLAPDNTVTLIDRTLPGPNGLALSPDGRTLIGTAQALGWVAWTLDAKGAAVSRRIFIDGKTMGFASGDGMKMDADGNLWTSSRDGLSVFNPDGKRIGIISIGSRIANCAIAADGHLYMAGGQRVARMPVRARPIRI